MNSKQKDQFQERTAVLNPNKVPDEFYRIFGSRILEILKTDKTIQERYEKETGKQFFK